MIKESEINQLSENLNVEGIQEFFRRNKDELVYFYHNSDIPLQKVTTLYNFEPNELLIPLRSNENGTFMVIYTNKKIAYSLIEQGFKVASTKLSKLVDIANSLKPVNGVFVQGNSCWFTIALNQLTN